MDNIDKKQYENLRHNFNLMVKIILGSDYYNDAQDVYQSDIKAYKDIEKKIDNIKYDLKMWRRIAIVMMIISWCLIVFK